MKPSNLFSLQRLLILASMSLIFIWRESQAFEDYNLTPSPSANDLSFIMNFFKSDKGHPFGDAWHSYTDYYGALFAGHRRKALHIFELGIGTNNSELSSNMAWMGGSYMPGASLRGWKYFFPSSQIYGADVDKNILFAEDRIQTFHCDQLNSTSIAELWQQEALAKTNFSILIEDGLHTIEANLNFFRGSYHKVAPGGIYVVEDVMRDEIPNWERLFTEWKTEYEDFSFRIVSFPYHDKKNWADNFLVVGYRHPRKGPNAVTTTNTNTNTNTNATTIISSNTAADAAAITRLRSRSL